jgi:hypothetical protein
MNDKPCNNKIYLIIIALLAILVLVFAYLYFTQKNTTQIKIVEIAKTLSEKDSIRGELNNLLVQYDTLKFENESMKEEFELEQVKIKKLLEDLKSNKTEVKNYKKELSTLREIMKSYIQQIDSLNTRNQILIKENKEVSTLLENEKQAKIALESEKQSLSSKVELASVLRADNMVVNPMKSRNRSTTKASKVEKIEICFSLVENPIIPSGTKEIYLRIARPDEMILANSTNDLFDFQGKDIVYSSKREVDYINKKLNSCIYFENKQELGPGMYSADLFAGGHLIGTTSFKLE